MCFECQKQFCPDACPNAPVPAVLCLRCSAEADYRAVDGTTYCADCICEMSLDEILRFCGFDSPLKIVMLMAGLSADVRRIGSKNWRTFVRSNKSPLP